MESRSDDRLFTPKLLQCLIVVSGFPGNVDDNVEGNDANTYRVVGGTRMLPFPTVTRDDGLHLTFTCEPNILERGGHLECSQALGTIIPEKNKSCANLHPYSPLKSNMTFGKSPIFDRKYIHLHSWWVFQPVISVFQGEVRYRLSSLIFSGSRFPSFMLLKPFSR